MEEAGFDATIVCSSISWQPEGGGLRALGYRLGLDLFHVSPFPGLVSP